jgi:putative aminopeptidase FrvX
MLDSNVRALARGVELLKTAAILTLIIAWSPRLSYAQFQFASLKREVVEARLTNVPVKNKDRKQRLEELFREAGCHEAKLISQNVVLSTLPNIICILPGASETEIVVGAHFDNQGAGAGIVDNWSGASMLPSLYEALSSEPRKHTFRFIGFTDEEKGLIGSAFYVRNLKKEDVPRIRAMVNLDTLGLGPAALWQSHADKSLADLFYRVADSLHLPLIGIDLERVGSTDSESFRNRKIASMTVHSITQQTSSILHSPADKLSALRLDDYYASYRLLAAYLSVLDNQIDNPAN